VIYLNLLRVTPEAGFSLNWAAYMIFAVVIGGLGTVEGPIVGAFIFFFLQQLLSDYGTWYLVLLGGVAALVVVFARRGLWGSFARRWSIDLFPVRRRLCLETVCFPEENLPAGAGAAPISETAPPGGAVSAGGAAPSPGAGVGEPQAGPEGEPGSGRGRRKPAGPEPADRR
jgi:hypothetical protein